MNVGIIDGHWSTIGRRRIARGLNLLVYPARIQLIPQHAYNPTTPIGTLLTLVLEYMLCVLLVILRQSSFGSNDRIESSNELKVSVSDDV